MHDEMEVRQLLAAPFTIEWNGRNLKLSAVTEGVISEIETACKLAAILETRENTKLLYPGDDAETLADRRASMKGFEDDMRAGLYSWGGSQLDKWRLSTHPGERAFVSALLEAGGTPLNKDDCDTFIVDCQKKLRAVYALIEWDTRHPNGKRPDNLMAIVRPVLCPASPTSTGS